MCIAFFLIVKCTKLPFRFLVFCHFQVWKWSSYVNRKFGGISESAHSSGPIWPHFLFMSKVRILMRFAINDHKIKKSTLSLLEAILLRDKIASGRHWSNFVTFYYEPSRKYPPIWRPDRFTYAIFWMILSKEGILYFYDFKFFLVSHTLLKM